MITVEQFIEEYNKCIDWNLEIRKNMNTEALEANPDTARLLDSYISTEKITPEDFDIAYGKVFDCENGRFELQVYSRKKYGGVYFWVTRGITKEKYIKERLHLLHREADETYDEVKKEIQKLQPKADAMKLLARETLRYGVD